MGVCLFSPIIQLLIAAAKQVSGAFNGVFQVFCPEYEQSLAGLLLADVDALGIDVGQADGQYVLSCGVSSLRRVGPWFPGL